MLLVPTDFSPCADRAVERAIAIAQNQGLPVQFLHVISPPGYTYDLALGYPLMRETLRPAAQAQMEKLLAAAYDAGVAAEHTVLEGLPPVRIVEIAKARKADMIVMGTHGRTGIARFLIGSTTEEVTRRAPCPVLIVRDPLHDPKEELVTPTEEGGDARTSGPAETPAMRPSVK
jgi:nucleotide-binding universal stress UspA family protein